MRPPSTPAPTPSIAYRCGRALRGPRLWRFTAGTAAALGAAGVMLGGGGRHSDAMRAHAMRLMPAFAAAVDEPAPLLSPLGVIDVPGAEIVAYDPPTNCLFVTCDAGVAMVHVGDGAQPALVRHLALPEGEATHVTLDLAGRGIGAVTIKPRDAARALGEVVLFSTRTGAALARLSVGYGPDSAAFSPCGRWLVVANEGEPVLLPGGGVSDPPGSVSVIDLASVRTPEDVRGLGAQQVSTVYFGGPAISAALDLHVRTSSMIRIHPHNRHTPALDLEPESIAIVGSMAYIALQENNAMATLDLERLEWVRLAGLGTIEQEIDASDRDGAAARFTRIHTLPMPDMMAAYTVGGRTYLVTANEGDTRGGDDDEVQSMRDHARLRDLAAAGRLDPELVSSLDLSPEGVGRLYVCNFSGDLTGDGLINRPMALGTRSMSVWDAMSMTRIADTGSAFERWMARRAPELFNASGKSSPLRADARSDDRGPEPEGVVLGRMGERMIAFVGLERPGAIAMIDVTLPGTPEMLDLMVTARLGRYAPEGLAFVAAEQSPTGAALLLAAYEVSGTVGVYQVKAPSGRALSRLPRVER